VLTPHPRPDGGWPAPAKLNLFLHITGRRADGYHTLQTVFQFIELCDVLSFTPRDDGRVTLAGGVPGLDAGSDLCVRAANLLRAETGCEAGVEIRLDKHIPVGAGLGGGSTDAATTLVALNRLWELGLSEDRLAGLGLKLGADVPVFVRGRAAWAEGVGERLTPVTPEQPWYCLWVAPVSVSTAAIFADPQLTRDTPASTITDFLSGRGTSAAAGAWRNDCEAVVRRRHPLIDTALNGLGRFAEARLTGTGSAVFAAFATRDAAAQAVAAIPEGWQAFLVRGMNLSPLFV
jgi:4-diphosphocytidyl-2-C-methyl-D-erythritol kinase